MANGLTPGPYSRQEDIFQIFQEPYPVYTPDPNLSDEMNLFLANKQLEARDSGVSLAQRLPHGPLMNWIDSIQTGPTESQEGWSLTGSVPMERNIPVHENKKMAAFLDDPTLPSSDYDPSIPVPAGFPSQLETLIASRPEIQQGRSTSGDPLQALKQGNRMRPRGKLNTDIPRYQAPTIPIPRTEPSPQDNSVVSTPSQQRPQQRPQPPNPLAAYDAVMKREPGFFQENAPLILGLLGGVSGLLEASGPSRVPVSGGQVFARGLQSGLKGYMGGLDYQMGMGKARQQEASNILKSLEQKDKIQTALDRRQRSKDLKHVLPSMYSDAIANLPEGDPRRKNLIVNKRLIKVSPETALTALQKLAPQATQFKVVGRNIISIGGDGKPEVVHTVDRDKSFNVINMGDGRAAVVDLTTGDKEIIGPDTTQATDPFSGKGMDQQAYNIRFQQLVNEGISREDALNQVTQEYLDRKQLQGTFRFTAPVDPEDPTKGTQTMMTDQSGNIVPVPGSVVRKVKDIPGRVVDGILDMRETARKVRRAQELMENKEALQGVGMFQGNLAPDFILNENAQFLRALLADLSSAKVLERSGAAVTASEERRLKPYVPKQGDDENVIRTKLKNFLKEFEGRMQDIEDFYSDERGYKKWDFSAKTEKKLSVKEIKEKYGVE